jgi:hypothetical protein
MAFSQGIDSEKQVSHIFVRQFPRHGNKILKQLKSFELLEISMSARTFEEPVFVKAGEGLVEEIATLEDAFDFLDRWPKNRRGVIYETARRACSRAFDSDYPLSAAREAFRGFARWARILEDVTVPLPWMVSKPGQGGGAVA